MKLAIVIPYYRLAFFEATLESLARQTDQRFRVYIGNDASPDDPTALLQKFTGKFDFEYKKFGTNLGAKSLVKQWERCIAMAGEEDFIMVLADDDVLAANVVGQFHQKTANGRNIQVIRYATQLIDENGTVISNIHTHPEAESSVDFLFRKSRSSMSEYIFSAKQIATPGFRDFPLAWFSDLLAVLEFSGFGTVHTINDAIVQVRFSDASISGNHSGFRQKNAAAFSFYHYLLTDKKKHFSREQQRQLLRKAAKTYWNDKRKVAVFLKLSYLYLGRFFIPEYFGFLKSIVMSFKKS